MKPRIRRRFGIWYCGIGVVYGDAVVLCQGPLGHGYTPSEALRDWKAQQ